MLPGDHEMEPRSGAGDAGVRPGPAAGVESHESGDAPRDDLDEERASRPSAAAAAASPYPDDERGGGGGGDRDGVPANQDPDDEERFRTRLRTVLVRFAPLGFIAFGGPNAHIALLQDRFVKRIRWVDDETFMELFGLCQALPGPTSTQLVVALATVKAGLVGGILSFVMWSLPGFLIMTVAGVTSGLFFDSNGATPAWMAGLGPAATAMVFVAVQQLSKNVLNSRVKLLCSVLACVGTLLVMGDERISPELGSVSFPVVLVIGGLITLVDASRPGRLVEYYKAPADEDAKEAVLAEERRMKRQINIPPSVAMGVVAVWLATIVVVETLRGVGIIDGGLPFLFESMFRIGSLIYGGGQVVLPMMLAENYCSREQFFQGFALVQALPGPLFNFSAFLGGVYDQIPGAVVGYIALNLPGLILIFGVLPFWAHLRRNPWFKTFIAGVSAAGLGLIGTAAVQLWESSVYDAAGAVVFVCSGAAVAFFRVPVPLAILGGALLGYFFAALGISQTVYYPTSSPTTSSPTFAPTA